MTKSKTTKPKPITVTVRDVTLAGNWGDGFTKTVEPCIDVDPWMLEQADVLGGGDFQGECLDIYRIWSDEQEPYDDLVEGERYHARYCGVFRKGGASDDDPFVYATPAYLKASEALRALDKYFLRRWNVSIHHEEVSEEFQDLIDAACTLDDY